MRDILLRLMKMEPMSRMRKNKMKGWNEDQRMKGEE
jgi:hypothetical protein